MDGYLDTVEQDINVPQAEEMDFFSHINNEELIFSSDESTTEIQTEPTAEPTQTENSEITQNEAHSKDFTFNDYFDVPEQFETHEEAVNWYHERLTSLKNDLMDPENPLTQTYIDNYVASRLDEEEEVLTGFAEAYKAMMKNPKEYLIQFVPEVLAEFGISPIRTMEEIDKAVESQLINEFGEDYRSRWNANELLDLNSFTSKVLQRRNELVGNYEQVNKQNQELLSQWNKNLIEGKSNIKRVAEEDVATMVQTIRNENYNKFVKDYGMSEQDYDNFLNTVAQRQLTLEDLHRVEYFENYVQNAYRKGLEDAKAGLYNKLNAEKNAIRKPAVKTQGSTSPNGRLQSVFRGDMNIPHY